VGVIKNEFAMIMNNNKTLKELKQEFNNKFPHLSIEFYNTSHQPNQGNSKANILDEHLTFGDVRNIHAEAEVSIDGHLKTSAFEQMFKNTFGVNVQVFRKAGDIWLQTTITDHWTLAEQERAAQEYEKKVEG
jgi:hypothetical protein